MQKRKAKIRSTYSSTSIALIYFLFLNDTRKRKVQEVPLGKDNKLSEQGWPQSNRVSQSVPVTLMLSLSGKIEAPSGENVDFDIK